jgi:hypothetical protein
MVRSTGQHAFKAPKQSDPVTLKLPDGVEPVTVTVRGPAGSSLSTVMVAECGPMLVGWKRMGTSSASPGPIVTGYASAVGAMKSGLDEVIFVTVNGHSPLSMSVSDLSAMDPRQTGPKSAESANSRLKRGGGASPRTVKVFGLSGSLLKIVICADLDPKLEGLNRRTTSVDAPGLTTSG